MTSVRSRNGGDQCDGTEGGALQLQYPHTGMHVNILAHMVVVACNLTTCPDAVFNRFCYFVQPYVQYFLFQKGPMHHVMHTSVVQNATYTKALQSTG